MSSIHDCILCKEVIGRAKDKYLVQGRSKEDFVYEIKSLPFVVDFTCKHICKSCVCLLKKRRNLIKQTTEIEERFKSKHTLYSATLHQSTTLSSHSKRSNSDVEVDHSPTKKSRNDETSQEIFTNSTPKKEGTPLVYVGTLPESPILKHDGEAGRKSEKTRVLINVKWPTKDYTRTLPSELDSLAKMLVRGTYKQIANAAWKNASLKRELQLRMMKEIDKECSGLCSKKFPSCLRSPTKEKLLNFSLNLLNDELRERAPITYSMLMAASVNKQSKAQVREVLKGKDFWSPAVGVAAAVCLRNRSKFMNVVQLQMSMFTYHSSWLVSLLFNVKCY